MNVHNLQDAIADRPRYEMLGSIFAKAAEPHMAKNLADMYQDPANVKLFSMFDEDPEGDAALAKTMSRECASVLMSGWLRHVRLDKEKKGAVTEEGLLPDPLHFVPHLTAFDLTAGQIDDIMRKTLTELSQQGETVTLPLKIETDRKTIQAALGRK